MPKKSGEPSESGRAVRRAPERKTETLSLRIDPRTKYGLDLLARAQRRAVTGVVEWAVSEAFRSQTVRDSQEAEVPFDRALAQLYADNEVERLLRLYFFFPSLLSFEEGRLVNVLLWTKSFWLRDTPRFNDFRWDEVFEQWEALAPVLQEAANRPVVRGLTEEDLERAGLGDMRLPF